MSHYLLASREALTCEDLLSKHRVVILAEAGSGKTTELREQVRLSNAAGRYTFFTTVQNVGRRGLSGALAGPRRSNLSSGGLPTNPPGSSSIRLTRRRDQGRQALRIEWDESGAEMRGSQELLDHYRAALEDGEAPIARNDGEADRALANAATIVEAQFEFPYLAHAALEPLNAVARMQDGVLEVWGGHQMPTLYQHVAADLAGVPPEKVRLT
jgi:hypothetical protein